VFTLFTNKRQNEDSETIGEAVHGTQRNEMLHMDYIYVMPAPHKGLHDFQWNLILGEDLTGMIKITPVHSPNAMVTVEALMEWRALFGSLKLLVTDMAAYFMSEVMREYEHRCNMKHHLTVAWLNRGDKQKLFVVNQSIVVRVEMGQVRLALSKP
jgi:hypothetical protein